MGPVRLSIAPHHANVRIARLVATSVCRLSGLDEELTDDVRLATGEACGRAVSAHRDRDIPEHVEVEIGSDDGSVSVTVQDHAPGGPGETTHLLRDDADESTLTSLTDAITLPDAIAIIGGLTDELEVSTSSSGATVAMRWHLAGPDD